MTIKNTTLSFFLLFSLAAFSQNSEEKVETVSAERPISFLDSIKNSFVKYDRTVKTDSLWMNQIGSTLDIYNDLETEINTVNIDKDIDKELPTELLKERLAAMDARSPFNIEYNQGLENLIKSFLKNRRKAFANQMAVAEYYFPLFEEALAKQNVPLEIKYLAVVESALNPKAVSRVGATGLWQFMYQTGKQYNLNIDSYVDERSDPLKSSAAAAQYMTNMFAIFNDWDLVLASYNSGPGNVTKAIRRSGGQQNFWNIKDKLPKETQGYVPAFLATMYIYEYHKEHGIVPKKALVRHFATDTVMVKKEMSFAQISNLLDIPIEQLQALNPSYKRNVIPKYEGKSHYLTLPSCKVAVFTSNEDKIYSYVQYEMDKREKINEGRKSNYIKDTTATALASNTKVKYYKVKRGDNLGDIAKRNDVAVSDLKKWNRLKGNSVAAGKSLKIIIEKDSDSGSVQLASNNDKNKALIAKESISTVGRENKAIVDKTDTLVADATSFYIVQKGDNLNTIAKKHNTTVAEIKEWNHLTSLTLKLGASLQVSNVVVPVTNESAVAVVASPELKDIQYEVQKGDNLGSIAKKFGASLSNLKQWNNLNSNSIVVGKSLVVAKNEIAINTNNASVDSFKKKDITVASSKNDESNYLVQKGDSLFSISKKYPGVTVSDLKKWNNITGDDLKPGMGLKIKG
ncbi:MAG TPA: LysM peptidoglycan-binding domain-containing protein [Flavobacterium sp.]|uniref:LysM peptidoglycan-binding domain-containing protein n=1 Tax=Flavobacterium sp. TaxID=239 RepID=UPI002DB8A3A6|nr:LysM peptidoglycan-binding domain-containing protein [Flavobacterium sp.]HEU4790004.1 LysM peptidoglycan-binding domain-containing protein [Flavobacterium sp.]